MGDIGLTPTESWEVEDTAEQIAEFVDDRRWGDGLPVIAPTPDRVKRMLASVDRDPHAPIGKIPPLWGMATAEVVAINSVMAGARPEYFPVILTAIECMLAPQFNLFTIQVTTNPVTPLVMVGPPIAEEIGMNGGSGYLGPGNRANATIGRAVRLTLMNAGGARAGDTDRATAGQPGKYTLAFAENRAESPWGDDLTDDPSSRDVVTAFGVVSLVNQYDSTSEDAGDILTNISQSLTLRGMNSLQMGGQILLLLCPEHASTLAKAGLSRDDIKSKLYEMSLTPLNTFPESMMHAMRWRRSRFDGVFGPDFVRALDKPEDLLVAVAGGPGKHSVLGFSVTSTEFVRRPACRLR